MGLSAICDHMVDSWYRLVRKDVVVGCADTRKRCCSESGKFLLLYQQAMAHAKTATIDSAWSTVGTANMDRLSLVGNFEVNVEVYDRAMACQMEDIFSKDASNTHELTLEEWQQRSLLERLAETILLPLRPLL